MLVYESIEDVLKPKSDEEINNNLSKILDYKKLKEHLQKYSLNKLLFYVYDEGNNKYIIYCKTVDLLLKNILDNILENYNYNWSSSFIIYTVDPLQDFGMVIDERLHTDCSKAMSILVEIDVKTSYNEKHPTIKIEYWTP